MKDAGLHEGHRQRMMEKLAAQETLQDHELLEILLFFAIPRKNTNEIAHGLINACGNLGCVFKADVKALASVRGVGKSTAAFLKAIGAVYERMGASELLESSRMVFSYRDFSSMAKDRFQNMETESVDLYALDSKNKISFVQSFTSGQKDHVTLGCSEISGFIVAHNPRGLVIAHNHPKGTEDPSPDDDQFTELTQMICAIHGVTLVDHVIVGRERTFSYFLTGKLDEIRSHYNIEYMLRRMKK